MARIQQCTYVTSSQVTARADYGMSPYLSKSELQEFYQDVNEVLRDTKGQLLAIVPLTIMDSGKYNRVYLQATIVYYIDDGSDKIKKEQNEF